MIFKILLNLNDDQKLELYKLGTATKIVFNQSIKFLEDYYKLKLDILSFEDILTKLKDADIYELNKYDLTIFMPIIKISIKEFSKMLKNKSIKRQNLNSFNFKIYFENDSLEINENYAFFKEKKYFPLSGENLYLKYKHEYKHIKYQELDKINLSYDGQNYFLEGTIVNNKNNKHFGLSIIFGGKYFMTISNGYNVTQLTDDEGFLNKCLVVLDLEKNINEKKRNNKIVFNAEINSLKFTKNFINKRIDSYIRENINLLIKFNPKFISIKSNMKIVDQTISDKINNYIIKHARNYLFLECKKHNIAYIYDNLIIQANGEMTTQS